MKLIAIDIGSTYAKSAVMQTEGCQMLEKHVRPMPERLPMEQRERWELPSEEIYQMVRQMIDDCLTTHGDVQAIYLDTQMHGHVLTEEDGSNAGPYVSWQDALAEPLLQELEERLGNRTLQHMGTRFKAGLTVCSLYARHKEQPLRSKKRLHTLGGYLIYRLSDGAAHVCHESMAASLGLYDCEGRKWNAHTLQVIGGEQFILPEIMAHTQSAGTYRGIPLYGDIGDHQVSVYGLGEQQAHSIVLTLGTAGILCMPYERPFFEEMESRPYFHNRWLLTKTRQPGGRTLDVWIDFMQRCTALAGGRGIERQQIWQALLEDIPQQTHGLQVKPDYFIGYGEGELRGISAANLTPQMLFAAAIDGLAEAYAEALEPFRRIDPALQRILLCGGKLAKLERLRLALEQKTGISVHYSDRQDEALYGLAALAAEQHI